MAKQNIKQYNKPSNQQPNKQNIKQYNKPSNQQQNEPSNQQQNEPYNDQQNDQQNDPFSELEEFEEEQKINPADENNYYNKYDDKNPSNLKTYLNNKYKSLNINFDKKFIHSNSKINNFINAENIILNNKKIGEQNDKIETINILKLGVFLYDLYICMSVKDYNIDATFYNKINNNKHQAQVNLIENINKCFNMAFHKDNNGLISFKNDLFNINKNIYSRRLDLVNDLGFSNQLLLQSKK